MLLGNLEEGGKTGSRWQRYSIIIVILQGRLLITLTHYFQYIMPYILKFFPELFEYLKGIL